MAVWSFISYRQLPYFRFDPEYYQPHYLSLHETLTKAQAVPIQQFAFVTDGIHGSPEWVDEGGVTYLSAKCVKDNFIDVSNAGKISSSQNSANPRTQARIDDVLITSVGTIGNAAVVDADILPANMDRHLGIIRVRADSGVDPYYLATFLNCEYGRFQSMRESTGNVQLNLFIEKIKTILVPIGDHYNRVGLITQQAYQKRKEAHSLYQQAQTQLLESLGLYNIDLSHQVAYTANFNDANRARRLDAEYFQPKHQRVLDVLRKTGTRIQDVASLVKRRFNPSQQVPFQYIEIGDIAGDGFAEHTSLMGEEAPSRAQWIVQPGDVITSTVRPIRRLSALIEEDQNEFVCSSGFAVLRTRNIAPELLFAYLRLPIFCEILDLFTTASMYPAISTTDLLQMPFALPSDEGVCQEIVSLVQLSRKARHEASQLIDSAKHQVENLIQEIGQAA
jgi:hypothetical protein